MIIEQKDLRFRADQHERNASILLSTARIPSYEDTQRAAEMERAKDLRALADFCDTQTSLIIAGTPQTFIGPQTTQMI